MHVWHEIMSVLFVFCVNELKKRLKLVICFWLQNGSRLNRRYIGHYWSCLLRFRFTKKRKKICTVSDLIIPLLSASSTKHDQCLQFPDVTWSSDHLHRPVVSGFPGSPAGGQSVGWDSDHHPGLNSGRTRRFPERQQRQRTQAKWHHYRYMQGLKSPETLYNIFFYYEILAGGLL